jgi:hypothetical protein
MKAAFVVFDRLTSLDFVGFYDPVTRLKSMNILDDFDWRVCSTVRSVVDDRGLRMEAAAVGSPSIRTTWFSFQADSARGTCGTTAASSTG